LDRLVARRGPDGRPVYLNGGTTGSGMPRGTRSNLSRFVDGAGEGGETKEPLRGREAL